MAIDHRRALFMPRLDNDDVQIEISVLPIPGGAYNRQKRRGMTHEIKIPKKDTRSSRNKGAWTGLIRLWLFAWAWRGIAVPFAFVCVCFVGIDVSLKAWHEIAGNIEPKKMLVRDYSHLEGMGDLTVDFVSAWCFNGRKKCGCKDPLVPVGRPGQKHWNRAAHVNKEEAIATHDVDVVFFGDSIVEGWKGTALSFPVGRKEEIPSIFEKLFTVAGGGEFEGIPLGISGDTSPNLLWRLQNGELPGTLNPSVFWVLIGTNDFGVQWCSPELVLIGILRVIEELRIKKPDSKIVVNGLFPRSFDKQGYVNKPESKKFSQQHAPRPSLWKSIEVVNEQLKLYCGYHKNVEYYETDIFFVNKTAVGEDLRLDEELMHDYLHPSAKGYELWGREIIQKLKSMLMH